MSYLFNRKAAVTFGKQGEPGTHITGLRTVFEICKDDLSSSNKGKISIFNLSEKHQAALKEPNSIIILDVGYGDNLDQLFIGDITVPTTGRSGADWVSIIEAGDGQVALDEATIDKAYAPGTKYSTVIKDVADQLKNAGQVVVDSVVAAVRGETQKTQSGICFSGKAADVMDIIMGNLGFEWSIQDNEIQALKPYQTSGEEAVLLTPQTGLVGSPVRKKEKIEIMALIQTTRIRPGRKVRVESRFMTGTFKIEKAKYVGDTHGVPWHVICEGVEI